MFTWLKGRGLAGVDLVVSDAHGGLVSAVRVQVQGASWQRGQTHRSANVGQCRPMSANVVDAPPKALQEDLHRRLRAIFEAPDPETARTLLAKFVADFATSATSATSAPGAVATLERGFEDATAVLALPEPYRQRLRTTNMVDMVERTNEEIRRRERVIRIFPNRTSVLRLLGALLMEQDETWTTGKRYFTMTAYWHWRATHEQEVTTSPLS